MDQDLQPPEYAPPQADPTVAEAPPERNVDVELAVANARAEAFREMAAQQRQADPVQYQPQQQLPPLPTNPLDLLTAHEREQMKTMAITDPDAYASKVGELSVKLAEARVSRAAAPIVAGQAQTIVALFKSRMAAIDQAYFAEVEPLFDQQIRSVGSNISNLVNMPHEMQTYELELRWKSAKADVMDRRIRNAPKPEPRLMASGGPGNSPRPQSVVEVDPAIAAMAKRYNFSPEQIAAIEGEV